MPDLLAHSPRPALRREHQPLGKTDRYKSIRKRSTFFLIPDDQGGGELVRLSGRGGRIRVTAEKLERDFIKVARCGRCGWHHDVRRPVKHA